jgi:hypothetical protein
VWECVRLQSHQFGGLPEQVCGLHTHQNDLQKLIYQHHLRATCPQHFSGRPDRVFKIYRPGNCGFVDGIITQQPENPNFQAVFKLFDVMSFYAGFAERMIGRRPGVGSQNNSF